MTGASRRAVPVFTIALFGLLGLCSCVRGSSAHAYGEAPEFVGLHGWLNAPPQSIESLRGQVVLVAFWSHRCASCANALPHIVHWQERYHDRGLAVVGIHSPQTEDEVEVAGLQASMRELGVRFPIALDDDHATWDAYGNRDWPTCVLVNREGQIVRTHVGEGDYEATEAAIVALLEE